MSLTISIKRFRNAVNQIQDERDSVMIKTAYLTASRNCEILNRVNPCEILKNATKPYGAFMKCKFVDFEVFPATRDKEAVTQKTMLITMAVAKRGKYLKQPKEGQTTPQLKEAEVIEALTQFKQTDLLDRWQSGKLEIDPLLIQVLLKKVALKVVALPVNITYEPWIRDLLAWILKTKRTELNFDLTRRRFTQILREHLSGILPKINKKNPRNPLRHFRINHLLQYYGFNGMEITNFVGWSAASASNRMGIPTSSNLDSYVHWRWQDYYRKLLKPISNFN